MSKRKNTTKSVVVSTVRPSGKSRVFLADITGKVQQDGSVRTSNGMRWKV